MPDTNRSRNVMQTDHLPTAKPTAAVPWRVAVVLWSAPKIEKTPEKSKKRPKTPEKSKIQEIGVGSFF